MPDNLTSASFNPVLWQLRQSLDNIDHSITRLFYERAVYLYRLEFNLPEYQEVKLDEGQLLTTSYVDQLRFLLSKAKDIDLNAPFHSSTEKQWGLHWYEFFASMNYGLNSPLKLRESWLAQGSCLLGLFSLRLYNIEQIGWYKFEAGMKIMDLKRWNSSLLEKMELAKRFNLNPVKVRNFWEAMHKVSCEVQESVIQA